MNLLEYDLNDLPENPAIICSGKRRSGKNFLTRDLCYNFFRGKIDQCFLFSPTAEIAINSMDFVPYEYRYSEYDIDVIDRILKRQEFLIRQNPKDTKKHRVLLILDDLQASNDGKKRRHIEKLFLTARHFRVSLIVNFQFPRVDMSPCIRDNCDVIFVFQQNNFNNKEMFALQYLSTSENKNDGYDLINKYATGYQTLVISNTEVSSNYQDYCFYYTADDVPQKFKLGKEYFEYS
jgi:hypothetical protein